MELGPTPSGTVLPPGPHLDLTDTAVRPQELPPTENLNNQSEGTQTRKVYLLVTSGAPDPDDEGSPSADDDLQLMLPVRIC